MTRPPAASRDALVLPGPKQWFDHTERDASWARQGNCPPGCLGCGEPVDSDCAAAACCGAMGCALACPACRHEARDDARDQADADAGRDS